jgi:hypothetical protein
MPMRGVCITLAEIEQAWPSGIPDLFSGRGVRLVAAGAPADVASLRFAEPCRWWWNADGDLVVEQE